MDTCLNDQDRELLDFERRWAGLDESRKIAEIRAVFGVGQIAYLQRLNRLLDTEAALAYDPHTVNRLRRTRARFMRSRSRRVL